MKPLNVLIIGGGGREHALAWAISQSDLLGKLFIAPGNAGTASLAKSLQLEPSDSQQVIRAIEENQIDFTIIGPEQPLVGGLVDDLSDAGYLVFGPKKQAAQLEGSKSFAKSVMEDAGVPTATWKEFGRDDLSRAKEYAIDHSLPVVIKADGLASGKGVVICHTQKEVDDFFDKLESEDPFGDVASRLVIEEFMEGEEASVFALTDGEHARLLPPVQDHKQIGEGDTGPNTGGMGAYLPAPVVDDEMMKQIKQTIITPVLNEMKNKGTPYSGVLYVGLMITESGPKVVEFNCRFGDPECQVLMPAIREDVLQLLYNTATGNIDDTPVDCTEQYFSCVMLVSGGYPGSYEKGKSVKGLNKVSEDSLVFHSGTKHNDNLTVTAGGRVLSVVAGGPTLEQSLRNTYADVQKINFEGVYYRNDIGSKGLKHTTQNYS